MFPAIPTGPITIALNGFYIDTLLNGFVKQYLPAYEIEITSGYRTPQKNADVGGAEYSAHLYNLARDFVLKDKSGKYVDSLKLKAIYEQFIKPNWPGYSYYAPPKTGVTGWVHVNADRGITEKTKMAEFAVTGISVLIGLKKIVNKINEGRKA